MAWLCTVTASSKHSLPFFSVGEKGSLPLSAYRKVEIQRVLMHACIGGETVCSDSHPAGLHFRFFFFFPSFGRRSVEKLSPVSHLFPVVSLFARNLCRYANLNQQSILCIHNSTLPPSLPLSARGLCRQGQRHILAFCYLVGVPKKQEKKMA